MATLSETSPVGVPALISAKGREKIVMLTAYDAPSARLLDAAGVDVLLVGDSVEMTVYGESSTLSATMDSMIRHARAVSRAAKRALVVGDMPFLSYQADTAEAVRQRRPVSLAGRLRGGQGGGGAARAAGRRGDPRRGHSGHGPRRADAAVLPQARRLQGPGAGGGRGAARSWRTPGRSRRRAASRSCSRRAGDARRRDHARDPDPDDRHRRRRRLRRAGARLPRRHGHEPGLQAAVRATLRRSRGGDRAKPPEPSRATSARGSFPSAEESFSGGKPAPLRRVH